MSIELQKASGFVQKLLQNRALDTLNILQKEEQIIQFLNANGQQLFPTLASRNFFPGVKWEEIYSLLVKALRIVTNQMLSEQLSKLIRDDIDLSFIALLEDRMLPVLTYQDEIFTFLTKILAKPEVRQSFAAPYTAVELKLVDKYIETMYESRQYLHFELTKVQRLRMGSEEIKNLIKITLLLKSSLHILTSSSQKPDMEYSSGLVNRQYVDKVYQVLKNQLKVIPDLLLRSALNSNLSFLENSAMEATSRITSIFSARAQSYKPMVRIDRGADTPDKSWFNIARRNYKFYGFDIKMLDEFYKIAAENIW